MVWERNGIEPLGWTRTDRGRRGGETQRILRRPRNLEVHPHPRVTFLVPLHDRDPDLTPTTPPTPGQGAPPSPVPTPDPAQDLPSLLNVESRNCTRPTQVSRYSRTKTFTDRDGTTRVVRPVPPMKKDGATSGRVPSCFVPVVPRTPTVHRYSTTTVGNFHGEGEPQCETLTELL